jgi:hypothetical protein
MSPASRRVFAGGLDTARMIELTLRMCMHTNKKRKNINKKAR